MCRGSNQRGTLGRARPAVQMRFTLFTEVRQSKARSCRQSAAPHAPKPFPPGGSQGHPGLSQPDPGVARKRAVEWTPDSSPWSLRQPRKGRAGTGTPKLQKRPRFREGQPKPGPPFRATDPCVSFWLMGPSQLKATCDPPPATGNPGPPRPRGPQQPPYSLLLPLWPQLAGDGKAPAPPSWASPLLSPRKWN